MGLNNILLRIKSKGYVPVLAHPERYVYMDAGDYRQLKEMNVMFQLNLSSIVGGYGTEVKKKAEWLLKNGFYDLAGSDTHGLAVLEASCANKNYHKPATNRCSKRFMGNQKTNQTTGSRSRYSTNHKLNLTTMP